MSRVRGVAVTCLVTGAAAIAGCGGGDDGSSTTSARATSQDIELPEPDSSDGKFGAGPLIVEALEDVQADFGAVQARRSTGSSAAICMELSAAAKEQLVRLRLGGRSTCEGVVEWIATVNREEKVSARASRVHSVVVDGLRAWAETSHGEDGTRHRVPFVDEGLGGWRLAGFLYAEPVAPAVWQDAVRAKNEHLVSGGHRAQLREIVDDIQLDFAVGDGASVCGELSADAEERLAVLVGVAEEELDCAAAIGDLARRNRIAGLPPRFSRLSQFKIGRLRATATLADPASESRRIGFKRTANGPWKLSDVTAVLPLSVPVEMANGRGG
jgi:hypothetical protein